MAVSHKRFQLRTSNLTCVFLLSGRVRHDLKNGCIILLTVRVTKMYLNYRFGNKPFGIFTCALLMLRIQMCTVASMQ